MTAEILAYDLDMGRNRIVPEYSFLDMRGMGALEDFSIEKAMTQVSAGDATDPDWRPLKGGRYFFVFSFFLKEGAYV